MIFGDTTFLFYDAIVVFCLSDVLLCDILMDAFGVFFSCNLSYKDACIPSFPFLSSSCNLSDTFFFEAFFGKIFFSEAL